MMTNKNPTDLDYERWDPEEEEQSLYVPRNDRLHELRELRNLELALEDPTLPLPCSDADAAINRIYELREKLS